MTELSGWTNFYVIVGSSAGALIGLQFVVITLLAQIPSLSGGEQAGHAFATPTVVHFGAVLLLAAVGTAPWQDAHSVAVVWTVLGTIGVLYSGLIARRMRVQSEYSPEFEDWLFHLWMPLAGYAVLAGAGILVYSHTDGSLFAVAAAVLLLLFIGIHNAWDAATYHVFVHRRKLIKKGKLPSPENAFRIPDELGD